MLGLVVLAAFALRLYRLDLQDIWWDEARNIDVASRPLAQIAVAPELDIHPPVYFYLLHVWGRLAGAGAFAMRFFSTWFGVLLAPLMYALGRRIGGRWTGLGAALAAAALPFLLGEAQETRMYTATLAWLACAGLAVLRAGDRGQTSKISGQWLLFALFSALALLTHYASVFALVALWIWALGWALFGPPHPVGQVANPSDKQRWPRLRAVLLSGALTALLCLPGLPVALRQIPGYRNPNLVVPSLGQFLGELAHVYGLGEHLDAIPARPWAWALAGWLVIGWLLAVVNPRRRESANQRQRHSLFAIAWALVPLAIYYLVIADRGTFATRYISVALPGWLLLAGMALRGWGQTYRGLGVTAALALVLILAPGLRGDLTDSRFFREDTRGVVTWLQANTDPARDLILVDQRYPFGSYYARWNNAADGAPPAEPATETPAQYLFVDINTVADRLNTLTRGRERVFWVRWFESDTDPRGATQFLLEKFGTRLGERLFRGYTVESYAVAPDAQFELAPALSAADVEFGGQVRLIASAFGGRGPGPTSSAAETRRPTAPADQPVWVVARWAALPAASAPETARPRGVKASVVLEDATGRIVGRDDRPILNDRHLAPSQWSADDTPLGVYAVHADPGTPPGQYTLKLAVYDPDTLAQLPAAGSTFTTLGQVTLTRAAVAPAVEQLPLDAALAFEWQGTRLLGRGALPAQLSPGDRLAFDLYWQSEREGLGELAVRLTLAPGESAAAGGAQFTLDAPLVAGYSTSQWAAGEVLRGSQRWQTDPNLPNGIYRLSLQWVGSDASVSPPVVLGQIVVSGRPHVFEPPAQMDGRSGARIGDLAVLLGYRLEKPDPRNTGSTSALTLTLFWQAEGASTLPYTVSAQLLDANGVLRAQRDQQPGAGAFPTTGWVTGEVLADVYRIELPADLAAANYALVVKVYDPATGDTLPVILGPEAGASAGDILRLVDAYPLP